ncbi:H-NS histone family protein [Propionivibrio soli]|uniref:H-NS histone family protein n=1 Tax=Propionivibrio soli TaxID=2976531 RepID=UPI0021E83A3A|nr:H-NS histone family protein [Propionivibrio soli]
MAKTYEEALKEIEALKKEAELLRKAEIQAAIAEAKAIIAKYDLSASDLGLAKKGKRASGSVGNGPKYRSDTNPNDTYGGKGPLPAWLKQKIAEGKTKEQFRVK